MSPRINPRARVCAADLKSAARGIAVFRQGDKDPSVDMTSMPSRSELPAGDHGYA